MEEACSMNWGEEERVYVIRRKARGKETARMDGWMDGWILERWDEVMWTGLVWLKIGTG
jgi:hypothetical protein